MGACTTGEHSPASPPTIGRCASPLYSHVLFAVLLLLLRSSDTKGILLAMSDFCTAEVCPSPKKADFFQTCADHSVHSFQADFKEKVTKRNSLQYTVFFVAVGLIFSGGARSPLAHWHPLAGHPQLACRPQRACSGLCRGHVLTPPLSMQTHAPRPTLSVRLTRSHSSRLTCSLSCPTSAKHLLSICSCAAVLSRRYQDVLHQAAIHGCPSPRRHDARRHRPVACARCRLPNVRSPA